MTIWNHIAHLAFAFREFVAPTYRPERHYMRGPGPKCREKQAQVSTRTADAFGMTQAVA